MDIRDGILTSSVNGKPETSIVDFVFDGYLITVFQGTLSQHDFIVKYKKIAKGSRLRQPSHTQWAVDFLLKLQGNNKLAKELLIETQAMWNDSTPLEDNQFETLKKFIESDERIKKIFTRKTQCWYVTGHWRNQATKDGHRKIFIQGYWKGISRDTKTADPRERELVVEENEGKPYFIN